MVFIFQSFNLAYHIFLQLEEDSSARHCAYCLQLCGFPAKLCGGCKKRAYCSKEF